MLTVRPTAFPKAVGQKSNAPVEAVSEEELQAAQQAAAKSEWIEEDVRKSGAYGGCGGRGHSQLLCVGIHDHCAMPCIPLRLDLRLQLLLTLPRPFQSQNVRSWARHV
jgi:hypothetical protein